MIMDITTTTAVFASIGSWSWGRVGLSMNFIWSNLVY
jgi:hypothetical protein